MPYTLIATTAQANNPYYKMCNSGSYLYLATDTGIKAYTFDGTSFTHKDTKLTDEKVVSCSVDSSLLHVLSYIRSKQRSVQHITSFTFNGSTFTQINQIEPTINMLGFFDVYSDDIYVYYTFDDFSGTRGSIRAINKSSYATLATLQSNNPNSQYGVGGLSKIGSYIVSGFGYYRGSLEAYSFDGSVLNFLASSAIISNGNIEQVACDNSYIFAIDNYNVYALSFDGSFFTLLDTYVTGDHDLNDLTCDSTGVYVTGDSHTFVLQFTGSFSLIQTIANTGKAICVTGGGDLIFSNTGNMYAYRNIP